MIVDGDVVREAGAILLVFALLGASVWFSRRSPARGTVAEKGSSATGAAWLHTGIFRLVQPRSRNLQPKTLEIVERLTLTPQHSLHLVRAGADQLLVATHAQGCTLLAGFPNPKKPVAQELHEKAAQVSKASQVPKNSGPPVSKEPVAQDYSTLVSVNPVGVHHGGIAV